MELWIRSQDKKKLCVAKYFELDNDETGIFCFNRESYSVFVGKYSTKERALEILDEIQNRFHQTFIYDLNCLVSERDYRKIKSGLEHEYPSKEFMIQPQHYELKPINSDVVIYEMPVE